MNVLLIEDEVNVSAFIKKGLEEESFHVEVAFDGYTGKKISYTGDIRHYYFRYNSSSNKWIGIVQDAPRGKN